VFTYPWWANMSFYLSISTQNPGSNGTHVNRWSGKGKLDGNPANISKTRGKSYGKVENFK
jgi:hypothetical protein